MIQQDNILVVLPTHIGDTIMSTPVFRALRTAYPDSKIYAMISEYASEIIKNNPDIDGIIIRSRKVTFRERCRLVKEIKKLYFKTLL